MESRIRWDMLECLIVCTYRVIRSLDRRESSEEYDITRPRLIVDRVKRCDLSRILDNRYTAFVESEIMNEIISCRVRYYDSRDMCVYTK